MLAYYPVSDLFRLVDEDTGLQLDFMAQIHGVKSFESHRSRATTLELGTSTPSSSDSAADAAQRRRRLQALRRESERNLLEQIERLLALPMAKQPTSCGADYRAAARRSDRLRTSRRLLGQGYPTQAAQSAPVVRASLGEPQNEQTGLAPLGNRAGWPP